MKYRDGDFFKATQDNSPNGILSYTIIQCFDSINKYEIEYTYCDGRTFKNTISEFIIDFDIFNNQVEYVNNVTVDNSSQAMFTLQKGFVIREEEKQEVCRHENVKKTLLITSYFLQCRSCKADLGDC